MNNYILQCPPANSVFKEGKKIKETVKIPSCNGDVAENASAQLTGTQRPGALRSAGTRRWE